jgi:hypothetical protein
MANLRGEHNAPEQRQGSFHNTRTSLKVGKPPLEQICNPNNRPPSAHPRWPERGGTVDVGFSRDLEEGRNEVKGTPVVEAQRVNADVTPRSCSATRAPVG